MKLTTTIRYALARLLLKAAALPVAPSWLKTTFFVPAFRALVKEGYKRNAAFFACVSALAFAFPEPPLYVYADETPTRSRTTRSVRSCKSQTRSWTSSASRSSA